MNCLNYLIVVENFNGNNNSSFNKDNLYCFEPLNKILKNNLQNYYNIPDGNFYEDLKDLENLNSNGKNLPALLILHDCFDISKEITDSIFNIFNEYKYKCGSYMNIKIFDKENKKIIAFLMSSISGILHGNLEFENLDFKNYTADYIPVRNLRELREKNQRAQREIIERHEDNGVQFISFDGIGISPFADISPGAVIYQGTIIRGYSTVGKNAILGPNTIIDNAKIGDNCVINSTQIYSSVVENDVKIGPFCHIRPNCVIKSGVKIGDFVEVKNSRIGENTKAAHLTYIGDSDVGRSVNFGCGTVTVNYDGIKKARCTIGDGAFIGCNTNIIAPPDGITIGENGYTAAGSTITKNVPSDSLAVSRVKEQTVIENWVSKRKNK